MPNIEGSTPDACGPEPVTVVTEEQLVEMVIRARGLGLKVYSLVEDIYADVSYTPNERFHSIGRVFVECTEGARPDTKSALHPSLYKKPQVVQNEVNVMGGLLGSFGRRLSGRA